MNVEIYKNVYTNVKKIIVIVLRLLSGLLLFFLISSCKQLSDDGEKWTEQDASKNIEAFIRSNNPSMGKSAVFPVDEIKPKDAWQLMHTQVFRVIEGVYLNETFLLTSDDVIQMGSAFGGMGVNNMLVSDLNSDGNFELVFTYGFGSGIHRTRIGAYAPSYNKNQIVECDQDYLGDLIIKETDSGLVTIEIVDSTIGQPTNITLGTLSLEKVNSTMSLILSVNPNLPTQYLQNIKIFK